MTSITKYPTWVDLTYTSKQHLNVAKYHLKHWDNLENLKKGGKLAMCTASPNSPIATKSGTYRRPASIYMGFGFKLSKGTYVEKIIVHYAFQTFNVGTGGYPSFSAPTFSFYNENTNNGTSSLPSKKGSAPTRAYTHHTLTFTGISTDEINVSDFGLIINFPENTAGEVGRLGLGDVYVELVVRNANITLNATCVSNKVSKGNTFNITCNVHQNDNLAYDPEIAVTCSSGLSLVKKSSGTGSFSKRDNIYYWDTVLDSNKRSSITISVKANATGRQTIKLVDTGTSTTYTLVIVVLNSTINITSNKIVDADTHTSPFLKVDEPVKYYISAKTSDMSLTTLKLVIKFPACAEIDNLSELRDLYGTKANTQVNISNVTVNKGNKTTIKGKVSTDTGKTATGKVVVGVTNKKYAIMQSTNTEKTLTLNVPIIGNGQIQPVTLQVRFNDSGIWNQNIYYNGILCETTTFTVRPKTYTKLAFVRMKLPEQVLSAMGKGIRYLAIGRARYVTTTKDKYYIDDLKRNLRFGVFHDKNVYTFDEDDFLNHTVFSTNKCGADWTEFKVKFTYNDTLPVYLVWTHEYLQSQNFEKLNVELQEPQLYEVSSYKNYENWAVYPMPVKALLGDVNYGQVRLPARSKTNKVILYNWDDGGLFRNINLKQMIIQGLQVSWDYKTTDDVEIGLWIITHLDNGVTDRGYRNLTLKKGSGTKAIGDEWDTFSIKPGSLRNLEKMDLKIVLNNRNNYAVDVGLKDFFMRIHQLAVNKQLYGFSINGERSEDYGIFLENDFNWDFGTKNEVKYYNTSGTDIHTGYRMNIDKKELSFKFVLGDCDFEEATRLMQKVAKLFTNDRDTYNKPILKTIIFDHMPGQAFKFLRVDPFDTKSEYGVYTATCKLIIPSGTSSSVGKTVTGTYGRNMGVARVQPEVYGNVETKGKIQVTETKTKQSVTITDKNIEIGDKIFINSEKRQVILTKKTSGKTINLTKSVDWSSTWFSVFDEYQFSSSSLNITSVEYYPRW